MSWKPLICSSGSMGPIPGSHRDWVVRLGPETLTHHGRADSRHRDSSSKSIPRDPGGHSPFSALEWLAAMGTHVPQRRHQSVKDYGRYANSTRGRLRKRQQVDPIPTVPEPPISSEAFRRNWARLIQKVFDGPIESWARNWMNSLEFCRSSAALACESPKAPNVFVSPYVLVFGQDCRVFFSGGSHNDLICRVAVERLG